jgi:hypothetical protein
VFKPDARRWQITHEFWLKPMEPSHVKGRGLSCEKSSMGLPGDVPSPHEIVFQLTPHKEQDLAVLPGLVSCWGASRESGGDRRRRLTAPGTSTSKEQDLAVLPGLVSCWGASPGAVGIVGGMWQLYL